tara:strand:- start:900 stop:1637 length:738 start_codon:yes stop_codon:yes gene_type:complete
MNSLTILWFDHRLNGAGYGSCDLAVNLSYHTGDGVAFYGVPDLERLAERLLVGKQREAAIRALYKGFDLVIEKTNLHIRSNHENTMTVAPDWWAADGLSNEEAQAAALLVEIVYEDSRRLARSLAIEGYAILEGTPQEETPIRTYRTKRYTVQISKLGDRFFSTASWTDDNAIDFINRVIRAQAEYFGVRVTISSSNHKDCVSEVSEWGLTDTFIDPSPDCHGYIRDLVRNCVHQYRDRLGLEAA